MSKPTRREKAVVFGVPPVLGAAFLVRMLTHGAVSAVAMFTYVVAAVGLLVWLVRKVRVRDREARPW